MTFKSKLKLAFSIILKEREFCETKHFCFVLYFSNCDNSSLIIDIDKIIKNDKTYVFIVKLKVPWPL